MINFERQNIEAKMKTAYDKVKNLKKKTKEFICIGVTVMMIGSFVVYDAATGVAYAAGSGEGTPHSIMVGEEEVAVVNSRSDAETVINNVEEAYGKSNDATIAMITPAITIEEKEYVTAEAVEVLNTKDATNEILDKNSGKDPLFEVVVTQSVVTTQPISYKTKVVEDDELAKGEKQVTRKGKKGEKVVIGQQTLVNGEVADMNVYSEEITQKPVNKIVVKGVKEEVEEEETAVVTSESAAISSSSSSTSSSSSKSSAPKRYNASTSNGVVGYAQGFHGVPYVWGGTSPSGFDCSGFTQYVYRAFGVNLPRTTGGQSGCGYAVSASEARPGDLVVMPGHVGIYAGNGMMVHAPRPGKSVQTAPIWQSCSYRRLV